MFPEKKIIIRHKIRAWERHKECDMESWSRSKERWHLSWVQKQRKGFGVKGGCLKLTLSVPCTWLLRTTSCKSEIISRERRLCETQKVSTVFTSCRYDFRVSLQPFPFENRSVSARHMETTGNKAKKGSSLLLFSISHPCGQNISPMQTCLQPNYICKNTHVTHLHNVYYI